MGRRPAFEEVEGLGGGPSTHRACERGAQNLSLCVYPLVAGAKHESRKLQAIMQGACRSGDADSARPAPLEGQASLPGRPLLIVRAPVPQLLGRGLVIGGARCRILF